MTSPESTTGTRPLRICMLTTFYPPFNFGGDGIGIQHLARALARRGHLVTVAHDVDAYLALSRGKEPLRSALDAGAEPDADPDIEVVSLRSGVGAISPLLTQQLGRPVLQRRRLRKLLDRGFDVTFFHNVSLIGGPGLLREGRGITIYEAHEHWLVCPTHVLWRHDREVCDARECLRCTLAYHRPPQLWRWTGKLQRELGFVDAFIAKSSFSRDKHHEFGFPRPMDVIPCFLPDEEPRESADRTRSSPQARPYFLFVGRLERIKGLDDVIPLFLGSDGPELLIAGEGDHGAELRQLAAGSPRVRFLGHIQAEQLRAYYEHAIALIVPSVGYETFGIILIEAFRYATPVIARRLGPFPEVVDAAGAGLLFRDREELVAAMLRVASDPALRSTLGAAGKRAFLRYWSEGAVIPQYLALIRRVAIAKGDLAVATALGAPGSR